MSQDNAKEVYSKMARLDEEQFVVDAIYKLRDPSRSQGIHTVYSGFNAAFKQYFGKEARPVTARMVAEGKLSIRPVKGGVMMYLFEEAPVLQDAGAAALEKMGLDAESKSS